MTEDDDDFMARMYGNRDEPYLDPLGLANPLPAIKAAEVPSRPSADPREVQALKRLIARLTLDHKALRDLVRKMQGEMVILERELGHKIDRRGGDW